MTLPDEPGALGDVGTRLGNANINVEYGYGSIAEGAKKAEVVLAVSDLAGAAKALPGNVGAEGSGQVGSRQWAESRRRRVEGLPPVVQSVKCVIQGSACLGAGEESWKFQPPLAPP